MKKISYAESERMCEATFLGCDAWWHLYTAGKMSSILFVDDDDYRYAMNLLARCHKETGSITIVAFEIMSNHIHIVLCGSEHNARRLFDLFRRRLCRYLTKKNSGADMKSFRMSLKSVCDLRTLRNTIVYVNRNGYVVNPAYTPFSYPWGTGRYYFNDFPLEKRLEDLGYIQTRKMLRSRSPELPGDYLVIEGHIAPPSYCSLKLGMSLFRNAHHYFSMVSKSVEAYGELAAELDDGEFLTDTELFTQVVKLLKADYGAVKVKDLSPAQKQDLARKLRYDYHSSNGQIRRTLNMTQYEVDSLFPLTAGAS